MDIDMTGDAYQSSEAYDNDYETNDDAPTLPKGTRVVIENLPIKMQWQALKDLIHTKLDKSIDCFVDLVRSSDGNSTDGLVNFNKVGIAARAMHILNGCEYEGRELVVREDTDPPSRKRRRSRSASPKAKSRKIVVGNLPYATTWQNLKDFYREQVGEVDYAAIDQTSKGTSKGSGIVSFFDSDVVKSAVEKTNNMEFMGRKLHVRQETARDIRDRERNDSSGFNNIAGAQVNVSQQMLQYLGVDEPTNIVYVGNLENTTQWQKLKDIFRLAGDVAHVKIMTDSDRRQRGCALVHYNDMYDAVNAISMLNGCEFFNRPMYVCMYTPELDSLLTSSHRQSNYLPAGLNRIGMNLQTLQARLNGMGGMGGMASGYSSGGGGVQDLGNMAYMIQSLFNQQQSGGGNMSSSRSGGQISSGRPTNTVCVENLDRSVSWQSLKDRFKAVGNVQFTDIIKQGGRSTGCGIVRFATNEEAERSVRLMNGVKFEGTTISVYLDN